MVIDGDPWCDCCCSKWCCCDNCFPGCGNSVVTLKSGKKYVEDVHVHDMARVVNEDGTFGWSEVWCIAHSDGEKKVVFKEITLENRRITGSGNHYIPVKEGDGKIDKKFKDVKVGDDLFVIDGDSDELTTEKVTAVEDVNGKGVFAPFTKSGQLLVNGVVVSCYSEVKPDIAHKALAINRMVFDKAPVAVQEKLMSPNERGVPKIFDAAYSMLKPFIVKS